MAFGDADLRLMLSGVFSVPVSYDPGTGAQETRGIFTRRDQDEVQTDGLTVRVRTTFVDVFVDALAGLEEDKPITVDGAAYRVRHFGPVAEGRAVRIHLAEVPAP